MRPRLRDGAVVQLNHPMTAATGGYDQGYGRVIRFDPRRPLPLSDDGTAQGMLWRRPGGVGRARNVDWDVQEVMNGTALVPNLLSRALWFAMLSRGVVRAGTANSDSHSLVAERAGFPRTLVLGRFDRARVDVAAFGAAVRAGHLVGTNGPVVEARVTAPGVAPRGPGVAPFALARGAALEVEVRAAPWVPVEEVRFVVNGRVARAVSRDALPTPRDPFGADGVVRWRGRMDLAELVDGRDAWVLVEAGAPLPAARDADGDDGLIDRVDGDGDGVADEFEAAPPREGDPRGALDVVAPGTLPFAFTNPFLVDVEGDGWRPR